MRISRRRTSTKTFACSDLNRQSGEVLYAALAAPVTLTTRGKPELVVMSVEDYERLTYPHACSIYDAPRELPEELAEGLEEFVRSE